MYCTVEDVKDEASMSDNPFLTDEEVTKKIKNAESVINGFIITKYSVPFEDDAVPYLINHIAVQLAAGMILKKDYGPMAPGDSKDGQAKHDDAMDLLMKLQKGTITLTDIAASTLLNDDNKTVSFFPTDASSNNQNVTAPVGPGFNGNVLPGTSGNGPYIDIEKKW